MNQQECMEVGINYEEGVSRFVGNAQLYEKFLREFLRDTTFAELSAAMQKGDVEAAFRAGHTLKGRTGNLSLTALYAHLVALVDALRGEGNLALARTLFPPVAEDYRRAVEFITARLG